MTDGERVALLNAKGHFWSKVNIASPNACWPWRSGTNPAGYGSFKAGGCSWLAHRVAFFLAKERDPGKLNVCHECDNPRCVNPAHLWLGTDQANAIDKKTKGRGRTSDQRGEANPKAKLRRDDIRVIVERFRDRQTNIAIGAEFCVSHATISLIRTGQTWKREAAEYGWRA